MMIPMREFSVPISIRKTAANQTLLQVFEDERQHAQGSMRCLLMHPRTFPYRRYRRGKNRCRYCGCKI